MMFNDIRFIKVLFIDKKVSFFEGTFLTVNKMENVQRNETKLSSIE